MLYFSVINQSSSYQVESKERYYNMELYDAINSRRSIRKYKPIPVEQEKLERIWKSVQVAPSACNYQPWRFLVVKSDEMRARVEGALKIGRDGKGKMNMAWAMNAPLIVIGLGNREKAWKRFNGVSSCVIDVSIAMEHIVLAAANEGLGTCWICAFDQDAMHKALELEPDWEPVVLTPLGYPDETPGEKQRKIMTEIIQVV